MSTLKVNRIEPMTGSILTVIGLELPSPTSSLSASYAGTASYVAPTFISASAAAAGFGATPPFPFTGSAEITASAGNTNALRAQGNVILQEGRIEYGAKNSTAQGRSAVDGFDGAMYAHAEGESIAQGKFSHSEGVGTNAYGYGSHSEGESTYTQESGSHAEGYATQTDGKWSHAEGNATYAVAEGSHAEGYFSQTRGKYSHAEGNRAVTYGAEAHAEGSGSIALGAASHAEGNNTITVDTYQHAQGTYNLGVSGSGAFIVGNGTDNSNRSNLVFGQGTTLQVTGSTQISGSLYVNDVEITGGGGAAFPYTGSAGVSGSVVVDGTITVGQLHTGTSNFGMMVGDENSVGASGYLVDSVIGGAVTIAASYGDITGDFDDNGDGRDFMWLSDAMYDNVVGTKMVRINSREFTGTNTVFYLEDYFDDTNNAIAVNPSDLFAGDVDVTYPTSVAIGSGAAALGYSSTAIGSGAKALGENTFAIGGGLASGYASFAGGEGTRATGIRSFAFGEGVLALADNQIVLGRNNEPSDSANRIIIGNGSDPSTPRNLVDMRLDDNNINVNGTIEFNTNAQGIIMTNGNGVKYRLFVTNAGGLSLAIV